MTLIKRRTFLKHCQHLSYGSAFAGLLGQSQLASAMSTDKHDYKALVCIFLFGGNDGFNMIVPTNNAEYSSYQQSRQNLATAKEQLLPLEQTGYGLHPKMPELQQLFQAQKLAILANSGALIEPVSKQAYHDNLTRLPPQLFSHNNQQTFVQALKTGDLDNGWAGRAADILHTQNINQRLSMNISLHGNNLWQRGEQVIPYGLSPDGIAELKHYEATGSHSLQSQKAQRRAIFQTLLNMPREHPMTSEFAAIKSRAWQLSEDISDILLRQPRIRTQFSHDIPLAKQLHMVANMISAREAFQVKRQIYFVGMGGFDTHGEQAKHQPELFQQLSQSMSSFNNAMEELGLANQVTSFTASDFGRTLTSNGDGTDHGWGNHQLMMGGAVKGGKIYGTMPNLNIDSDDDVGEGRIIPTMSVDQMANNLLHWFGLNQDQRRLILPNSQNFADSLNALKLS